MMAPLKRPIQKIPEDEPTSPQEPTYNSAHGERRTPRVALRSGSPKTPARVTLRPPKPKYTLVTPCPTKTGQSLGSAVRIRAPVPERAKVPWASPSAKVPAYHERKASLKRSIPSETEKPPLRIPTRRSATHYSISSLLALRPSQPTGIQRNVTPAITRHWNREEFDLKHHRVTSSPLKIKAVDRYKSLSHCVPVKPVQEEVSKEDDATSTIRAPLSCLRQPRTLETPTKQRALSPKNYSDLTRERGDPKSIEGSSMIYRSHHRTTETSTKNLVHLNTQDDQAAKVEDLESRIRSALSNRGRRRHFESPRKIQSVKWDPAIVDCGPIISTQPIADKSKVPVMEVNEGPESTPQNSDTENEIIKALRSPATILVKPKKKDKAHEYMKTITELKKGDRRKLLQLLEALRNIDSDDSSDTDAEAGNGRWKYRSIEYTKPRSKLNPKAPAFGDLSKAAIPLRYHDIHAHQPSINVPRRRPHIFDENHNPYEPVWHKTIDRIPEAKREGLYGPRLYDPLNENAQHTRADRFESLPTTGPHIPRASQAHYQPHLPNMPQFTYLPQLPQPPLAPPPLHHLPQFVHANQIPYLPYGPQVPVVQQQSRVNTRLPVINLATGRIPSEGGTGREAQALDPYWANNVLGKFVEKYPLTGNLKAGPPVPIQNRHAATIQQRLEYLLMEQKEKKAREKLLGNKATTPTEQRTPYQLEKEALMLIGDLSGEKDLDSKDDEEKIEKVLGERISEASTCVGNAEEPHEPQTSLDEGSIHEASIHETNTNEDQNTSLCVAIH